MKDFEYFKVESLKEASELLLKYDGEGHIINGGTDLLIRLREGITKPNAVIDIKGIEELNKILINEDSLFIGACVNLNEIARNRKIKELYPFFADSAISVASNQVRNRATCIGNVCNASPLADTATPLMALDAEVIIYGPEGEKIVPITEFFVFVRKTVLKTGEIVKGIRINHRENVKGSFSKLARRKEVDLSLVCSSVVKVGSEFKVSFGAVAPTPVRLSKTEEFLNNKELTDEVINEACNIATSEVAPISDIRASKEYRTEMVEVLLRRGLNKIK
ncbi:FAD binding domain-containing protein [Helicovermis profundi]|uniref:Xanthine dehydrogenase family protein subunit M n=1 Tax=Helicovermis profundi TaxID=3065157 RepID=A0AAU9ENF5_9FIRM|nr:xanthine dehydrogenase family protein subunit M [Clostridia bacterium S502]